MRLLRHLVAADVRCHRWLLVSWLAVVVAATVVDGIRPVMAPQPAADNPLILLGGVLYIAWVLLRVVVVAQVIHTHPVVGSMAFWPTRPIPPLLLLRAKTVLLAVTLIIVPVAAEAMLMAVSGVTFGELLRVAADTALFAALWVALLVVPAVLTRTFSRFTLACCAVLAALALYIAISITVSSFAPPSEPTTPQISSAVDYTGLFVFVAGLIAACGLTMAAQYRWRRPGRTIGVVVAGVVATMILADRWSWPVLRAEPQLPSWATASSLSLATNPDATRTYSMTRNDDPAWKSTAGGIEVAGLPPGWSAETALLEANLEIGGGRLTSAPAPFPVPAAVADGSGLARHVVIQRLLGATTLTLETPPTPPNSQLLVIPEGEFNRFQPARGRYRGRHYVQLVHHTAEAVVPLRPGATVAQGSYHLSVAAVMLAYRTARVRVRESNATSRLDRRVPRAREFFVVNRQTGAAYALGQGEAPIGLLPRIFSGVSVGNAPGEGFLTQVLDLRFPPAWQPSAGETITQEWLANADLVVVVTTREGALELPLVAPDFRLDEAAGSAP